MAARRKAWAAIRRIAASDRISGLIMLGCAVLGLVLANLPATAHLFETVAETHLGIPGTDIDLPLGHWAQDGLLTIFFLTVGLDLKQELTTGSLANPKAAAVPMLCAVGGMVMPPILFLTVVELYAQFGPPAVGQATVASGTVFGFDELAQGWAIPTATDIAFSLAVLRARVNAQLRRSAPAAPGRVELDGFLFDFARLEFFRNGEPIDLSKTEQRLLRLLVENRGRTLPREQLLEQVWDGGEYVDENALSVAVRRLRAKLEDAPIKTVYGVGYTWEVGR